MLYSPGNGDHEKIHQKSPPLFNAKFPGEHEKKFTKCFWRAGKVIDVVRFPSDVEKAKQKKDRVRILCQAVGIVR